MIPEFPEGRRPDFCKLGKSPGRVSGSHKRAQSRRFDDHLMRLFSEGRTFKELGASYLLALSTVRDRVYNAQERTGADSKIPNEERRRAQARAWKKVAVLFDAARLTTEGRRDEMLKLADEEMVRARRHDEEIGQP